MDNRHMKRFSTSLIIREMQIQTTMGYYLTSVRMAKINNIRNIKRWQRCKEIETLVHCCGCQLVQSLWKTVLRFLEKLKLELSYDLVVALLDIYHPPKKNPIIQGDKCILFIAALLIIAKLLKQPKCPLIDRQMDEEVRYIYRYNLAIKRMKSCHLQQHGQI